MDLLLNQSYNYAVITPVKNYANIKDRNRTGNTFINDIDDVTDIESMVSYPGKKETDFKSVFFRFSPKETKQNIKYFYNKGDISEKLELIPPSDKKKNYYVTKDRQIKKYYGDPFCRVEIKTHKRLIYRDENKVIIKTLFIKKYRSINWKFFRENKYYVCISFNLKTGNFTIIQNSGITKKRGGGRTHFSTNNFEKLKRLLNSHTDFFMDGYTIYDEKTKNEFLNVFNDKEFFNVIDKELLKHKLHTGIFFDITPDNIFDIIVNDFVVKRNIKVPNEYKSLLINYYPTQKFLKKNDNKLIQSILDMFGVKCKSTIKYLHENPDINISQFVNLCYFFGKDYYHYINKIVPTYFKNNGFGTKYGVHNFESGLHRGKDVIPVLPQNNINLSKEEKDNILSILNESAGNRTWGSFEGMLVDHFRMIESLKRYEPNLKLNSRTIYEFNTEHNRLSNLIMKINKGWTIEYQFNEKMLNDVESDLVAIKDEFSLITFKPFILKRDEDYSDEGKYMHHCVAGYTNKDKSMIISLRTEDGVERVTCEFDIQSGRCLQSRYFSNQNPPDFFLDGLELLKEKVQKYARWGLLNWTEKKKVPMKINGIEVVIEEKKPRTFEDVLLEDPFFNRF